MNQMNQIEVARAARDIGISKTARANTEWLSHALLMLPRMKQEFAVTTGEGIRLWLGTHGLDEPSSPHAWGMLTRVAMKKGILRDTGRMGQMYTKKSHARRTPLWEIV